MMTSKEKMNYDKTMEFLIQKLATEGNNIHPDTLDRYTKAYYTLALAGVYRDLDSSKISPEKLDLPKMF